MVPVCIYAQNRGLGPCEGSVAPIRVASPRTIAWTGLHALAERLQPSGEEPGVCQAHQSYAESKGYLIGREAPTRRPASGPRRPRGA